VLVVVVNSKVRSRYPRLVFLAWFRSCRYTVTRVRCSRVIRPRQIQRRRTKRL